MDEEKLIKTIIKKSPYDEKCTEEIARICLEVIGEEKYKIIEEFEKRYNKSKMWQRALEELKQKINNGQSKTI